jgi:hypothetical protein
MVFSNCIIKRPSIGFGKKLMARRRQPVPVTPVLQRDRIGRLANRSGGSTVAIARSRWEKFFSPRCDLGS